MSTWIAGLGALSRNVGEGIIEGRELKARARERDLAEQLRILQGKLAQQRLQQEKEQFEFNKQLTLAPQALGKPTFVPGKGLVQVSRDPRTGAISLETIVPEADPWASLEQSVGLLSPDVQTQAKSLLDAYKQVGNYAGAEKLLSTLLTRRPPSQTELQKMQDRATMADQIGLRGAERNAFIAGSKAARVFISPTSGGAGTASGGVADLAQDIASGQMTLKDVPVKQRAAVATYMRQHGMKAAGPATKLTTQEKTAVDVIQQGLPMIDRVIGLLEPNKADNSVGAEAAARMNWFAYKLGFKVAEPWQSYIQVSALLRVMNTQQFLHGIRNMTFVQQIQQHMPNPEHDTPAMAYDKSVRMKGLMQQMLAEYRGSAAGGPSTGNEVRFEDLPQ